MQLQKDERKPVEYRPVPGFPGYRLGDDGSQWTCRRRRGLGPGFGTQAFIGVVWKQLKVIRSMYGYAVVGFCGGKQKRLGRLMLEVFVGPCPEGMQCCHNDGDRMNSRLDNLRWGTPKSNADDRDTHGTTAHGERIASSRFTECDIREMYRLRADGSRLTAIAAEFATSDTVVWNILNGRSWKRLHQAMEALKNE